MSPGKGKHQEETSNDQKRELGNNSSQLDMMIVRGSIHLLFGREGMR